MGEKYNMKKLRGGANDKSKSAQHTGGSVKKILRNSGKEREGKIDQVLEEMLRVMEKGCSMRDAKNEWEAVS